MSLTFGHSKSEVRVMATGGDDNREKGKEFKHASETADCNSHTDIHTHPFRPLPSLSACQNCKISMA